MAEDFANWFPMTEDYNSLYVNSYRDDQTAANLPATAIRRAVTVNSHPIYRLLIRGFPSDVTESGLKRFMVRIGCAINAVKVMSDKSGLGRPLVFAEFPTNKALQRGVEALNSQSVYKLTLRLVEDVQQNQLRQQLIDRELRDFDRKVQQQYESDSNSVQTNP